MELWIKETNPDFIEKGAEAGLISGVVISPATPRKLIDRFHDSQEGPIAIPLEGETEEEILEEAQELFHYSNRILPILNFRPELLATLHHLYRLGIGVACKVESPLEGWLSSKAGAAMLIAQPLSFVFLDPKRWRTVNGREVPLFLEMEEGIDSLFTAPVEIQGAILPRTVFEPWIVSHSSNKKSLQTV